MKNLFRFAILTGVAFAAASCTKDNTADVNTAPHANYTTTDLTIVAHTADADSRTTVDEEGMLVWSTEEQSIAVVALCDDELTEGVAAFDSGRVSEATCDEVTDEGKAIFKGGIKGKDDATTLGYIAAYPHAAFTTLSGKNLTVTLPDVQTPAADNIDPAATLLFASALEGVEEAPESLDLYFRHVAAYGRICIHDLTLNNGDKIASVVVSANKDLAGEWSFDYTDKDLTGEAGSETSNAITLDVAALDASAAATEKGLALYFSALPVGAVSNFTVKVVTAAGLEYVKSAGSSANISFDRKVVTKFAVDFSGVAPTLPESQVEKLTIILGNTSWPGHQSHPFENLFNGIIDEDAANGDHYHTDWDNPKSFPVTLDFTLASPSYVSSIRYYTRNGNGLPGKFDVLYRQIGQSDFTPISENYNGTSDNAQYNMYQSHYSSYSNVSFAEPLANVVEIRLQFYNGSGGYLSGREVEIYGKSEYRKLALTADNFTCPFVAEQTLAELCDNDVNTFMGTSYWGVAGGSDSENSTWDEVWRQYSSVTAVWGVYVDIALPAAASDMFIYLNGRNGNGTPVDVILGKSTDGEEYTQYAEATALECKGKWVKVCEYKGEAVKHIRLGVTKSNMGDLKTSPAKSTAIAEIEVWTKN